jgi:hypothetical protein
MSEYNPLIVEYEGREIEVEDPSSEKSFLEAFKETLDDFARDHYAIAYETESSHYEIDAENQQKFADAVENAIKSFRKNAALPLNDEDRHDISWKDCLDGAIYRAIHGESFVESVQEEAQDQHGFHKIYQAIDEAMSEYDGPVCDLDNLWSEMSSQTVWKMEEHDTSTLYDTYGKAAIKFIYMAGLTPGKGYRDDLTLYLSNGLQEIDPDTAGFDTFINLFKVDPLTLMERLNVDNEDTDLIDKWVNFNSGVNPADQPLLPLDSVIEILENAGCNYGHPCWMGELTLNEFAKLDPLKPLVLTGGCVGINDTNNGCGYMIDLPAEAKIVLTLDEGLCGEWGCEMECSEAFVKNHEEQKPKVKLVLESSVELN